jgi:hypothetical protein
VVECTKNQIAPPFGKADCLLKYGEGFDQEIAIITQAEKWKIVEKTGNTYSYKGDKLGVGINNAANKLKKDEKLRDKLMASIKEIGKW